MINITDGIYAAIWRNYRENNCNTYVITNEDMPILIDPGHYHLTAHWEQGLEKLGLSRNDIRLVIVTHGHPDHLEGVALFDHRTKVAVGEREYVWLQKWVSQLEPDLLLREGELKVGKMRLEIIEAPGHSPASICIYAPDKKVLFTGDVIFRDGIGRTDIPGGDVAQLKNSIKRLSHLDVEYLLPGHGEPVIGRTAVERNFRLIEEYWFQFI